MVKRDDYLATMGSFSNSLKILVRGITYAGQDLERALRNGLELSSESVLSLAFHTQTSKRIPSWLLKLQCDFPGRVFLYWAAAEPKQYYAVVDGRCLILFRPDSRFGVKPWGLEVKGERIVQDWISRFDSYASYCQKML